MEETPIEHRRQLGFTPLRRTQDGFTLLEVLVSVIVLSFGLLGMVGMQFSAMQANRDSSQQSAAVRLGAELAELMRDNKDIALERAPADNPYLYAGTLASSSADCSKPNLCSDKRAVAQWGFREWLGRVGEELPGARVQVCYDEAPFDSHGLPRWTCSNTGAVLMVKIGWARRTTHSGLTNAADNAPVHEAAFDRATVPSLILPVTAGADV